MGSTLLKPVFVDAMPVVGLKALPPAENVVRTLTAFAVHPSVECTFSFETMRLNVALISTAAVYYFSKYPT